MKKIITSYLSVTLAAVILASSSGLFVNRMDCLMSGNSLYSFTPFTDCRADDCDLDINDELAKTCCNYSKMLLKMNININLNKLSIEDIAFHIPVIQSFECLSLTYVKDYQPYQFSDLPPPKTVASKLAILQTYLI